MSVFQAPWYTPTVQRLLDLALEEDAGRGDVTSGSIIDEGQEAEAEIIARNGWWCADWASRRPSSPGSTADPGADARADGGDR